MTDETEKDAKGTASMNTLIDVRDRITKGAEYLIKGYANLVKIMDDLDKDKLVLSDLCTLFVHARSCYEATEETRKRYGEKIDKLSRETIPERFKAENISTMNILGVGRVTVSYRFSASIPEKEKGMEWLRSNGFGDIIIETVNSSTLASFCKSEFVEKNLDPPEVFKVSTSPFTSVTKAS